MSPKSVSYMTLGVYSLESASRKRSINPIKGGPICSFPLFSYSIVSKTQLTSKILQDRFFPLNLELQLDDDIDKEKDGLNQTAKGSVK